MLSAKIAEIFLKVHQNFARGIYEIEEHIDFCFTCIAKTLTI